MSKLPHIKDRQARIARNNTAYQTAQLMTKLVRKLIRDGFTILKMGFDHDGAPLVEIQHCKHCAVLGGAMYRTDNDTQGKKYTWQKLVYGCRVEWITTGVMK